MAVYSCYSSTQETGRIAKTDPPSQFQVGQICLVRPIVKGEGEEKGKEERKENQVCWYTSEMPEFRK